MDLNNIILLLFVIGLVLILKKIEKENDSLKEANKNLKSEIASREIKLGQTAEQLAPFLQSFPYDAGKVKFLGQPLDYVYFGEDRIVFIEVKSGNSKLSNKQKHLKQLIQNKQVFWDEIRISKTNDSQPTS